MRWTSRHEQTSAIATALATAVVAGALLLVAGPARATPPASGPLVLPSAGAAPQLLKKEVAGPPAPSQGTGKSKGGGTGPSAKGKGKDKGKEEASAPELPPSGVGATLKELGDEGQVDPISGLGIGNPICDRLSEIRDRMTRQACEETGSPESHYPASNYGFDVFIDTGVDAPEGTAVKGLVRMLDGIWLAMVFVLRLIFDLLGLAFGLNPFGDGETMHRITGSITRLYSRITSPWLATLVVIGGIWFAYKGLIRREVGAGAGGTLAALAMLIFGLWIVHAPGNTAGRVANMSNDVALSVVSAPQSGSVSRPTGAFAEALSRTWPRLVEIPFAGLNFSDVKWAMGPPPAEAVEKANEKLCDDVGTQALMALGTGSGGDEEKACEEFVRKRYGKPKRVIDLYLRSSPNSPPREALWQYFDHDEADLYKAKVAAQGGDGVLTRLSMLALFAVGLLGALLLLAWLAIRLFTQAAIGFLLLLAVPFALFFPLLGESGRKAFKTWGLTLLGALVAKVVYAAFLSLVLLGIAVLGKPGGSGGFLLASAFSWAVFLKRSDLVGWLSVGDHESRHFHLGGHLAAHALGRWVWRTATGTAGTMTELPNRSPERQQAAARRDMSRPRELRGLGSPIGVAESRPDDSRAQPGRPQPAERARPREAAAEAAAARRERERTAEASRRHSPRRQWTPPREAGRGQSSRYRPEERQAPPPRQEKHRPKAPPRQEPVAERPEFDLKDTRGLRDALQRSEPVRPDPVFPERARAEELGLDPAQPTTRDPREQLRPDEKIEQRAQEQRVQRASPPPHRTTSHAPGRLIDRGTHIIAAAGFRHHLEAEEEASQAREREKAQQRGRLRRKQTNKTLPRDHISRGG